MARLIQKSGYIQGGRAARYMEYVAKRDGVEVIQSTEPVTKKQMQFLTKLLKDFPDAKELFEYADYLQTPNRGMIGASGVGKTAYFLYPNLEYACASGMSFLALDTLEASMRIRNYPIGPRRSICTSRTAPTPTAPAGPASAGSQRT